MYVLLYIVSVVDHKKSEILAGWLHINLCFLFCFLFGCCVLVLFFVVPAKGTQQQATSDTDSFLSRSVSVSRKMAGAWCFSETLCCGCPVDQFNWEREGCLGGILCFNWPCKMMPPKPIISWYEDEANSTIVIPRAYFVPPLLSFCIPGFCMLCIFCPCMVGQSYVIRERKGERFVVMQKRIKTICIDIKEAEVEVHSARVNFIEASGFFSTDMYEIVVVTGSSPRFHETTMTLQPRVIFASRGDQMALQELCDTINRICSRMRDPGGVAAALSITPSAPEKPMSMHEHEAMLSTPLHPAQQVAVAVAVPVVADAEAVAPPLSDNSFLCPLSRQIMSDPVTCSDGYTYERTAIESWFSSGQNISPVTKQLLPNLNMVPNYALHAIITQRLKM